MAAKPQRHHLSVDDATLGAELGGAHDGDVSPHRRQKSANEMLLEAVGQPQGEHTTPRTKTLKQAHGDDEPGEVTAITTMAQRRRLRIIASYSPVAVSLPALLGKIPPQ